MFLHVPPCLLDGEGLSIPSLVLSFTSQSHHIHSSPPLSHRLLVFFIFIPPFLAFLSDVFLISSQGGKARGSREETCVSVGTTISSQKAGGCESSLISFLSHSQVLPVRDYVCEKVSVGLCWTRL